MAAVVCAAGIAVVSGGLSAALRAEASARDLDRAAALLDLTLARLDGGVLELEDQQGDFAADGAADVRYEVALGPGPVDALKAATVTVRYESHGVARALAVERWVFVDPEAGTQ